VQQKMADSTISSFFFSHRYFNNLCRPDPSKSSALVQTKIYQRPHSPDLSLFCKQQRQPIKTQDSIFVSKEKMA